MGVDVDTEPGFLRDFEAAIGVDDKGFGGEFVDVGAGCEVFDVACIGEEGGDLQVGGESDSGIPAVWNDLYIVVLCQPCDAAEFAETAIFGDIRLDDINGAALEPWLEGLAASEDLAPGDGNGRLAGEFDEAFDVIRWESFFEPDDIIVSEHFGGIASPVGSVWPELFAAAGVNHEFDVIADGLSGGADEEFVEGAIATTEGAPAHFDGSKAAGDDAFKIAGELVGFVEENGAVWADAIAVAATEEV